MTTALKLYQATDALLDVRVWIDEHADDIIALGGELPDELAQLLDLAEGQFNEKVERVALYVRELLATADAIDAEAKRLAARAKAARSAADGLKGYLKLQMETAGIDKVKGVLATVRIQKNSRPTVTTAFTVLLADLSAVPEYAPFIRREVNYRVDADAVLRAQGPLPDGIAIEHGTHLRIA